MYCSKCGSENDNTSAFCSKCGTGLNKEVAQSVVESQPKKKKSKKLPFIIAGIAVIIIAVVIAANWEGDVDYIATAGAHKPFVSQETSLTYSAVLNKYIDSPKWEMRKSGDIAYVDVSGTVKGTDIKMVVTIKVAPNPSDRDAVSITPESITLDGKQSPTKNDAAEFLLAMFYAYEEGYNDISELLSGTGAPNSATQADEDTSVKASVDRVTLDQNYTNEAAGFAFDYPNDWEIVGGNSESEIVTIRPLDIWSASFIVYETVDVFDTFTAEESTVQKDIENTGQKFVSLSDVSIDGIPAKKLVLKNALTGIQERIFMRYYYAAGETIYEICGFCETSELDTYEPIFDAIIESYTITPNAVGNEPANNSVDEGISNPEIIAENVYEDIIVLDFIAGSGWDLIIGWVNNGIDFKGYIAVGNEYIWADSGDFMLLQEDDKVINEGDMFIIKYTDDVHDDYPDGGIYKILAIESYYGNAKADGFE